LNIADYKAFVLPDYRQYMYLTDSSNYKKLST